MKLLCHKPLCGKELTKSITRFAWQTTGSLTAESSLLRTCNMSLVMFHIKMC